MQQQCILCVPKQSYLTIFYTFYNRLPFISSLIRNSSVIRSDIINKYSLELYLICSILFYSHLPVVQHLCIRNKCWFCQSVLRFWSEIFVLRKSWVWRESLAQKIKCLTWGLRKEKSDWNECRVGLSSILITYYWADVKLWSPCQISLIRYLSDRVSLIQII